MTTESHLCRGLLFDMDGTLIDSFASADRAWSTWAEQAGLGEGFSLQGSIHGRQRPDAIRYLLPDLDDAAVEAGAEAIRIAERDDVAGVVALPGANELLRSLPARSWAIVTSCDEEVARARLKEAGLPVPEVLITADAVDNSKPHPEGFLLGAERLGFSPDETIVFEDAPAGIEAGIKAGMRVIASRHSQDDDEALVGAIDFIDDPSFVTVEANSNGLLVTVSQ